MKYNRLGKTDLAVSEIGFGCQSIAGGLYYKNDTESISTLREAYERGVNFFDTSDHYTQGESEILIGKAFKGMRDKVIIGTKAGTLYTPGAGFLLKQRALLRPFGRFVRPLKIKLHLLRSKTKRSDFSAAYLKTAVEKSLRRLNTDYIDLFQLHKPSVEILEKGEFIEALEALKSQGKIRYYGISTRDNAEAFLCFKYPGISSVQITANLLDRNYLEDILSEAVKLEVGVIARNPRAQGHLTDERSDILAETYANNNREFEHKKQRASKYMFLAGESRTLSQSALRFILRFQGISTVIPRAVNRIQLLENINTLNTPLLTPDEIERIHSAEKQTHLNNVVAQPSRL